MKCLSYIYKRAKMNQQIVSVVKLAVNGVSVHTFNVRGHCLVYTNVRGSRGVYGLLGDTRICKYLCGPFFFCFVLPF